MPKDAETPMDANKREISKFLASLTAWDGKTAFGLEGISNFLELCNKPQDRVPAVHVAGTNGKGSVCMLLGAMLEYGNKSAGVYLSPPVADDTHRFILDGKSIGRERFDRLVNIQKIRMNEFGLRLSLFELYQTMAFEFFLDCDYQIIEVGLGGRLDASNVLRNKVCSVITSIGLDHQNLLGDTPEKIAREKAGIVQNGEPVVIGAMIPSVRDIINEVADMKGSKVFAFGSDFLIEPDEGQSLRYKDTAYEFSFNSSVSGEHQRVNLGIAIFVGLNFLGLAEQSISRALTELILPGRLEVRNYCNKNLIFDIAHNLEAVRALCSQLKVMKQKPSNCLFAVYRDKDWMPMLDLLSEHIVHWDVVSVDTSRGLETESIANYLSSIGISSVRTFANLKEVCFSADTLVTGSAELVKQLKILHNLQGQVYWSAS